MTPASARSLLLLIAACLPQAYLYLLVVGAVRRSAPPAAGGAELRLAVVIPAHDEGTVIGQTVGTLLKKVASPRVGKARLYRHTLIELLGM